MRPVTGGDPAVGSPDEAGRWLGASLDLTDIAGLLLEFTVPKFATGGGVFVLERMAAGQPDSGADPCADSAADPRADSAAGDHGSGPRGGQIVARRLCNRFIHEGSDLAETTLLPHGEVVAFAADSPYGQCLSGGKPTVFGQPDSATMVRLHPGARAILSSFTSFLAVPMTAPGTVTGMLVLTRTDGATFTDAEIAAVAGLARSAGACVANATEFARRRLDSEALKQGLAPSAPPPLDRVEVAWRSTPAPGQVVGGDWWDIVSLPGGRTGLVVGDVMEHGPTAAMLLAQLRAAAHTLADLDLEPAEMMQRLDRSVAALTGGMCATCVYAVVDPGERSCTMSLAGHLSPVLALPDGRTYVPALPAGMPVGLGAGVFGQARIKLPPGAVLALYTDGLVESRTRSFRGGILALRAAISGEHGALADTCDALMESLRHHEDDVTVMLARIPR